MDQGSIDALYQSFRDAAEQGSIDAWYQSFKAAEQRRTDFLCQSLRDAAEQGSIDALYALIRTNADVLDSMDKIPIVETPLHIAASLGHTEFSMEIMKLKPSFARKLNQDGFTPMHLALQKLHELEADLQKNQTQLLEKSPDLQRNQTQLLEKSPDLQRNQTQLFEKNPDLQRNQTQLVLQLLDVDKDLVRVQGREGVTPLHYVAQIGNLSFLAKFFKACPESLEDVTIRNENVLHIALKYDMFEAFQHLLLWLGWAWFKDARLLEEKLLYSKDGKGDTLLHIAVSKNQPEVVWCLLDRGFVNLKAKNLEGKTVFDILEQHGAEADYQQMRDMLRPPCVSRLSATVASILIVPAKVIAWKLFVRVRRLQTSMTDDRRNALLVVAALLLTVTFQAGLSPPHGEVPKALKGPLDRLLKSPFQAWMKKNTLSGNTFVFYNTITYYLTTLTIFFLLPPDLIGLVLYLLLLLLFLCYSSSPPVYNLNVTYSANTFFLSSLTLLPYTTVFVTWLYKKLAFDKEEVIGSIFT